MRTQRRGPPRDPNDSDADLLAAARTDSAAFRVLYDRYAEALHAFVGRRVLDHHLALDITAETFAQAWRSRGSFRDERDGSAAPWLFGIARNVLAGAARTRRLEAEALTALGVRRHGDAHPGADVQIESDGLDADLEAALAALPTGQRRAVELRVLNDHDYSTVAAQLGTSETAARIRVHRGLSTMRATMATPEETP